VAPGRVIAGEVFSLRNQIEAAKGATLVREKKEGCLLTQSWSTQEPNAAHARPRTMEENFCTSRGSQWPARRYITEFSDGRRTRRPAVSPQGSRKTAIKKEPRAYWDAQSALCSWREKEGAPRHARALGTKRGEAVAVSYRDD